MRAALRAQLAVFLAFAALIVGAALGVGSANAHHYGDFLPYTPTPCQISIENRGYGIYALDSRANTFTNFRADLRKMYDDSTAITGIRWYEVGTVPSWEVTAPIPGDYDLLWSMPDTWQWGDGAAGVAIYSSDPARIDVNWRVPYANNLRTVTIHESGHACDGQEDLYYHPLTCRYDAFYTRMSCGTLVTNIQPYDRDITWNTFVPDLPSFAVTTIGGGYLWVGYNGIRASSVGCIPFSGQAYLGNTPSEADNFCGHPSIYLDNVTRVAIFIRDNGGDWYFSGYHGSPAGKTGANSRGFWLADWCPPGVHREWGVRPENMLTITWHPMAGGIHFISGDVALAGACP